MNEFPLFAYGEAFDPDAYLSRTTLKFDGVWRKGESGHDHPQSSGVYKVLGDGYTTSIHDQERIAIQYLSANTGELKALAKHPNVATLFWVFNITSGSMKARLYSAWNHL